MTEWLRNLWCDNPTGLLAGAASGIMVWAATYAVAKPISHIREKRLEALQFAERYGHLRSTAPEESIRSARSAVGDLAAGMRALARDRLPG
jgi:hypothetical protein